jgi:hypothetical protein
MATTGSTETQRTPGPVPGCNRPGAHNAEQTVEVVRSHRDGTRTAVGILWSKPKLAWGEWTRVGTSEEGHPTIPREDGLPAWLTWQQEHPDQEISSMFGASKVEEG